MRKLCVLSKRRGGEVVGKLFSNAEGGKKSRKPERDQGSKKLTGIPPEQK